MGEAIACHGNAFDYSRVVYTGCNDKVLIGCRSCGQDFWQAPSSHRNGKGCPACAVRRVSGKLALSVGEFVEKARKRHGSAYDYSRVEYKNLRTKVWIGCKSCGRWWQQQPADHLVGRRCPTCSKQPKASQIEERARLFLDNAIRVHGVGRYGYERVNYVNNRTPIEIDCSVCNAPFFQRPQDHLNGKGCRKCGNKLRAENCRLSTEHFIAKARATHGDRYDYSLSSYISSETKILIGCKVSGHRPFLQNPGSHARGNGCPACGLGSQGEAEIAKYLDSEGIRYEREKRFPECRDTRTLSFDFYLPNQNSLVEFDGEQHFSENEHWGGEKAFADRTRKDAIKTHWAIAEGYHLIRISYDERENIPAILKKRLRPILKGAAVVQRSFF